MVSAKTMPYLHERDGFEVLPLEKPHRERWSLIPATSA
jgi:hypothetical protein